MTAGRRLEILLALPAFVHAKGKHEAAAHELKVPRRTLERWLDQARELAAFGFTWPKGAEFAIALPVRAGAVQAMHSPEARMAVWSWLCAQRQERGVA